MTIKLSPRMKKYLSLKQWMFFWYRHYKAMFFFGFLIVLVMGGYFWYRHLYQYQWSEETKKSFIEQHFKETRFQERAFESVVKRLEKRAAMHQESLSLSRDIFSGEPIE